MVYDQLITQFGVPAWVIGISVVWMLIWKGLALWKSAKLGQKGWFIAMLILQTLGILEILYLYVFSPRKRRK